MEFFTAGDVLRYSETASPENPVTVDHEDSIQTALEVMLDNGFSQLPVLSGDFIEGAITYKSVVQYVKSFDEPNITDTSVKIALNTNPKFVDQDHDIFQLFETLAEDEYVLIGSERNLEGILTRYDVFYFLEDQVDPFLKIGDIEEALRTIIRESVPDLESCIQQTFADRAEHDDRFEPPKSVERLTFDQYRLFMMRNLESMPERITNERAMVETLLEDIRDIRNALLHFRAEADEVDRDQIDIAHGYFTGLANSMQ